MLNVYAFLVEEYNEDKSRWVYYNSYKSLYSAQCDILTQRKINNKKYRILEVVDIYV